MKITRNASLDIIRAIAVYMVLCVHSIIFGGFMLEPISGLGGVAMTGFWVLSSCCVPLFLMLSGFLMNRKKFSVDYYLKYLYIFIPYFVISCISLAYKACYLHEEMSLRIFASHIMSFYGCEYAWYLMMYTGLYMLIPFLNSMYHSLESKRQKQLLIIFFAALSHLPSLLNSYLYFYYVWFTRLYPFTFYFIGCYFSEYRPKYSAGKYLACILAFFAVFSVYDVFYIDGNPDKLPAFQYEHYQVLMLSVLVFCWGLKLNVEKIPKLFIKTTKTIAEFSFYVFLISGVTDNLVYKFAPEILPYFFEWDIYSPFTPLVSLAMSMLLSVLLYPVCEFLAAVSVKVLRGALTRFPVKTA